MIYEIETYDGPSPEQVDEIKKLAMSGVVGNWAYAAYLHISIDQWTRWRRLDRVQNALFSGRGMLEVVSCQLVMQQAKQGEPWAIKRLADSVAPGLSPAYTMDAPQQEAEIDMSLLSDAQLAELAQLAHADYAAESA